MQKYRKWRGIDLDPYYEAKVVKFLEPNDLFWIVGNNSVPNETACRTLLAADNID